MNTALIIEDLSTYNEHELFYREYCRARKNPQTLREYLKTLDPEYIRDNYLVVPELTLADMDSAEPMPDFWYFNAASGKSVLLQKHNRYTPAFTHTHAFFEMLYVLKGTCTHHIFDRSYEMVEGDLCLLSPSVVHSIYTEEGIVLNILIRRSNMEDIFFNILRDKNIISDFLVNSIYLEHYATFLTFHTLGDEETLNQILEMYLEQTLDDAFSDRIVSSMLIIFFTKLARKYKRAAESPFPPEETAAAAQLLHCITNEYRTITLNGLSDRLGYSVPYCSKYIRKLTGYSFLQLLKHVRFQKAENLLQTTSFSIQKISDLIGYENPENFMRAFKKEYGMSPSAFRSKDHKVQSF